MRILGYTTRKVMSRKKDLETYLRGKGWASNIKDNQNLSFNIYTHPQYPLRQILVPKEVEAGYEEFEKEALRRLSEVEERTREEIQKEVFPSISPVMVGIVFAVTATIAAVTYGLISFLLTS